VVVELFVKNKGTWAPEEVRMVGLGEILPGAIVGKSSFVRDVRSRIME